MSAFWYIMEDIAPLDCLTIVSRNSGSPNMRHPSKPLSSFRACAARASLPSVVQFQTRAPNLWARFVRNLWEDTLMIKDLVKDEAVLSQPCDAVTAEEAAALAADLTDTLESLENVACLHANQLGVTKAAFIYLDADDKPHIMFNAKMIRALGAFKTTEDCLSREEESKVTRYAKAKISYQELAGDKLVTKNREFTDWTAEIIQHMIDHSKGKLV